MTGGARRCGESAGTGSTLGPEGGGVQGARDRSGALPAAAHRALVHVTLSLRRTKQRCYDAHTSMGAIRHWMKFGVVLALALLCGWAHAGPVFEFRPVERPSVPHPYEPPRYEPPRFGHEPYEPPRFGHEPYEPPRHEDGRPLPPPEPKILHLAGKDGVPLDSAEVSERIAKSKSPTIMVESPQMIAPARAAVAASDHPDRLVVLKRTDGDVSAQVERLRQPATSLYVLHTIPTTRAEALGVHGVSVADIPDDYWEEQHKKLEGSVGAGHTTDVGKDVRAGETVAEAMRRRLDGSDENMLLIIGEVRAGALRFSDGSALPLADVKRDRGLVTVLGCTSAAHLEPSPNSIMIGAGRRITYSEAIDIAGAFDRAITPDSSLTPYDLLLQFQRSPVSGERAMLGVATLDIGQMKSGLLIEVREV